MTQDDGHTVERARSGLGAATALVVSAKPGERRRWVAQERYWRDQLRLAEKRGAA
jgi:hypothetical protein